MGKQRSIGSQAHHIGITFQSRHKSCFGQCRQEIIGFPGGVVMRCIFTGKDFRSFTVIVIIAGSIGKEPVGSHIIMLVHQIHPDAFHFGPEVIELVPICTRTGRTYNLHIGIFRTDGFREHFQTLGIDFPPLFIADGNHFQTERFGMSHIGTHLSPLGGCSTVGKLDEVEGILHVRAEFSKGNHFVAFVLAGQPAAQYRQRLCTEVFTQQEIFVKAKSVTLEIIRESFMLECIVPAIFVQRTVLYRTHGILPLITGGKAVAFDDTTAGKTEYSGIEVIEGLYQVGTQSILTLLPSVHREERDVVHIYRTLRLQHNTQTRANIGKRSFQHSRQLLPFTAFHFQFLLQEILSVGIHQFDGKLHWFGIRRTDIGGETVIFSFFQADATITFIIQSGTQKTAVIGNAHIMRIAVEAGPLVLYRHLAERYPPHQRLRELKRAVLYQFGIQTTVRTEIDVFEEDSIHGRIYPSRRF